eukprot:CAMPEP_0180793044 /NCGR_PEP_ID=MMETSP1038_2-20121128/54766_1 /TAXON_ID=632150 /ORGANISM="Azadinium spinosum, Strain 3D9" /LENGTH=69 /DNA_ID=CAMNT_0022831491 /DNA_START=149 /DNA_END=358 /DNA_ORIENTATION=-
MNEGLTTFDTRLGPPGLHQMFVGGRKTMDHEDKHAEEAADDAGDEEGSFHDDEDDGEDLQGLIDDLANG